MIKNNSGTYLVVEGSYSLQDLIDKNIFTEKNIEEIEYTLALQPLKRGNNLFFVGLLENEENRIFSLPKYCTPQDVNHAPDIINLLRTAQNQARSLDARSYLGEQRTNTNHNRIELALQLFRDFTQNGLLQPKEYIYKRTQAYEPTWAQTINKIEPIFTESGAPIYSEWIGRHALKDNLHIITRIHSQILRECQQKYGLILGFRPLNLEHIEPLPSHMVPVVIQLIKSILSRIYKQREVIILKYILDWLESNSDEENKVKIYGTLYFEYLWENICTFIFQDKSKTGIWKNIIPTPQWYVNNHIFLSRGRFILDLISTLSQSTIMIGDAKYYTPEFKDQIAFSTPGMDSISKQVHYLEIVKSSLKAKNKDFYRKNRFFNAFIFPANSSTRLTKVFGYVWMSEMMREPIYCISLDPFSAVKRYLNNQPYEKSKLKKIESELDNSKANLII